MKDLIGQIRTVILQRESNQGVVVESYGSTALVALPSGTRTLPTAIAVAQGDTVTVHLERIVAKRSSRTDRTYYV